MAPDPKALVVEDENPNHDETEDDGLSVLTDPIDPAEVGEDDGSTVEHREGE